MDDTATPDWLAKPIADLEALADGRLEIADFATWIVRDPVEQPDGTRIHSFPFPSYSARAHAVLAACEALLEPAPQLDYLSWSAAFTGKLGDPDTIATMNAGDLLPQLTWMVRGERFCDGHWANLFANGAMRAALCRARALGLGASVAPRN